MSDARDPLVRRQARRSAAGAIHRSCAGLRSTWWAFLAVPAVLAVFIGGFVRLMPEGPQAFLPLAGLSVLASLSVGLSIGFAHGLMEWAQSREWWTRGPRSLPRLLTYVAGTLAGGELTFLLAPDPWIETGQLEGLRWPFWGLAAVIVTVVSSVHGSLERLRERARASERLAQERERAAVVAELSALQARTQPHFLFNALNLVSTLIEEDPAQASRAVDRLSNLLRYSMRGAQNVEVLLSREVAAVCDYLELQKMRFGDRLRFRIHCDSELERALVLPMLIQPLVENSVNHAVARRRNGAFINVDIRAELATIHIEVSDDGPGATDLPGSGSAHENLRDRLRLHYGEAASFCVNDRAGDGYTVSIRLPWRKGGPSWND